MRLQVIEIPCTVSTFLSKVVLQIQVFWSNPDPVSKIMINPDLVLELWSDPDPIFKILS